jgi:hypothetical protein
MILRRVKVSSVAVPRLHTCSLVPGVTSGDFEAAFIRQLETLYDVVEVPVEVAREHLATATVSTRVETLS